MTDTAYKTTWQHDIYLIEVGVPGPPGTGFTASEAVDVRNRLTTLEGRPNITTLESLTNVPDTVAANGQSIIANGAGQWGFGNPNGSLTYMIDSWSGLGAVNNVTVITTGPGLRVKEEAASGRVRADIQLQYGASGTSNNVAREDHSHNAIVGFNQNIAYQGVLSTGSKVVNNTTLTGLDATNTYDIQYTMHLDVVAAGVDSLLGPRVRIGPSSEVYQGFDVKFKGYGKVITVSGLKNGVTGVTSYALEARVYFNGGPQVELGAGQVIVTARPRR